jgi:hypothetical protein
MVARLFTTAAFLVLATAGVQALGATAQAVASATILPSAALHIGPRSPQLEMAKQGDTVATRYPRQTTRPCDAKNPIRCTLIIFDLL